MKTFVISFLSTILVLGCASSAPTSSIVPNKPSQKYSNVVIMPFTANNVFVEEEKYEHLPKQIAAQATQSLRDQLSDFKSKGQFSGGLKYFDKVLIGGNCLSNSIKIEGDVQRLIHSHGQFHVLTRIKVSDCTTEEVLYESRHESNHRKTYELSEVIASSVVDALRYRKL